MRPVYGHPIAGSWLKIGTGIYELLDSRGVKWTSIDPVTFANAGEKTPFSQLLMWIGVKYKTLPSRMQWLPPTPSRVSSVKPASPRPRSFFASRR